MSSLFFCEAMDEAGTDKSTSEYANVIFNFTEMIWIWVDMSRVRAGYDNGGVCAIKYHTIP